MAEIVFSVELRGSAAPVEGKENTSRTETTGTGGGKVDFESEVII